MFRFIPRIFIRILVIIILVISSVHPLRVLQDKKVISAEQGADLRKLADYLVIGQANGRRLDAESLAKAKGLFKTLAKSMSKTQMKQWLRDANAKEEAEEDAAKADQAALEETELQHTLKMRASSLLNKPYVEQEGRHDFLVIDNNMDDPFVTVIPNAIYYNIEKKCVNWLDDCSLKGIRERLLHGSLSP